MIHGLRVTGLRRSYGAVPVLRGIDLDVPAGALTAVVGPSGCGKTTLLRLIAGFDRPEAGTIAIGDRTVTEPGSLMPPERRRIGYVTQDGNLFPHLTVAGNITFGLPRSGRRARHRVGELLELVGLESSYADRRPDALSGGQQQRVALARALAPHPDLVLLDEPFSPLDAGLRASTRRAVVDALAASGTTTLLVTHDQAEALSSADRLAVMRDGVIVQEGSPVDLYHRPGDRGVAAFLGEVVHLPAGFAAAPTAGPRNGDTSVIVRPEQLVLTDSTAAAVSAEVLTTDFFGPYAEIRLRTPDGTILTARCPGHLVPGIGDRVGVRLTGSPL
jgi:iron(III) transport system ATP-binding protein